MKNIYYPENNYKEPWPDNFKFKKELNKVFKIIKESKIIFYSDLVRKTQYLPSWIRNDLINTLTEAELIIIDITQDSNNPKKSFRIKS